jgi:hypothetical protein
VQQSPSRTGRDGRKINKANIGKGRKNKARFSGRGIDRHVTQIPHEAEDCQIVAVVRHPLDRLVSLWHHLVRFDAYHGRATMAFYPVLFTNIRIEVRTIA